MKYATVVVHELSTSDEPDARVKTEEWPVPEWGSCHRMAVWINGDVHQVEAPAGMTTHVWVGRSSLRTETKPREL